MTFNKQLYNIVYNNVFEDKEVVVVQSTMYRLYSMSSKTKALSQKKKKKKSHSMWFSLILD